MFNMLKMIAYIVKAMRRTDRSKSVRETDLRDEMTNASEIGLCYRDDAGVATQRMINPRAVTVIDGRAYLEAFCQLHHAPRKFRLDRIEAIVTSRGQILAPIEYIRKLRLSKPVLAAAAAQCVSDEPLARVA